jgi:sterol desaturase/sphingolipid hydroxylase (fatty acid hydroxylase superfamily)
MVGLALGLLAWTVAEYAVHRFMLHGLCSLDHVNGHHSRPADYSVGPSWVALVVFFLVLWVVLVSIGNGFQAAGFTAGYLFYAFVHYASHHRSPSWRWLRWLVRLHAIHHARGDVNFAVSVPLWDVVCGTYKAAR